MKLLLETPSGEFRRFISESRKAMYERFGEKLDLLGGGKLHVVSAAETFDEAIQRIKEAKAKS